jgi:hypothetical protein
MRRGNDVKKMQGTLAHAATDEQRARFYHGNSMLSIFRPGDYLIIEPASIAAIRPGDVVVFQGLDRAGEPDDVVHRVIAVTPDGLVTRGDNNPQVDDALVTQDNLLGRVTHVEREGRARPVPGGRRGLLRARTLRVWARVRRRGWQMVRLVGRWPYRLLRTSGLVRLVWQPTITRIRIEAERGPLVKYLCGMRTVAWWWPETGRFRCRRPYDLVIHRPGRRGPCDDEAPRQS